MANASACPATIAATAHHSGRWPSTTANAPSRYMTGLRKKVKLIANRSRQRAVRSSGGIGSTPNSSIAGTTLVPAVPLEEVDHDPVVLLRVVEDRRVVRAPDHV